MTYLYIFIGGGLGSLARFLTSKATHAIFPTDFPVGTLAANILACAVLAILTLLYSKSESFHWIQPLLLIGFCGGYSTFSTFGNETFELVEAGEYLYAAVNVIISLIVGVGLIFIIRTKAA